MVAPSERHRRGVVAHVTRKNALGSAYGALRPRATWGKVGRVTDVCIRPLKSPTRECVAVAPAESDPRTRDRVSKTLLDAGFC